MKHQLLLQKRDVNKRIKSEILPLLIEKGFKIIKRKMPKFVSINLYRENGDYLHYLGIQTSKYGGGLRFEVGIHPKYVKLEWTFPEIMNLKNDELTVYDCEVFLRRSFPAEFLDYSKYSENQIGKFINVLKNEIKNVFEWFEKYSSVNGIKKLTDKELKVWKGSVRADFYLAVCYIKEKKLVEAENVIGFIETLLKNWSKKAPPVDSLKKYPEILRRLLKEKK